MIIINVTFKVLGTGIGKYYQARMLIYSKSDVIYSGCTFNGQVTLYLKKNHVYKVHIQLNNNILDMPFYILDDNFFIINFNKSINKPIITFLLTDDNYLNLPIMKGGIILDQSN